LRRKGVEEQEARSVVEELVKDGWIDDRRFSAAVARSEAAKGKGPMAVLFKLRRRGVRTDLASARKLFQGASLAAEGDPEIEAVRAILSRRFPDLNRADRKQMGRAYQALLRRGFSPASIQAALKMQEDQ
jgi:SOS response regulatory protein OraA/RecX